MMRPSAVRRTPAPARPQRDIFEDALANATSHKQTYKETSARKRGAKRMAKFTTVTLTALLLIAFYGYQNLPNLNMRLASSKAGFSAKMPDYKPSGFSYGKLSYAPGTVTVDFNASDNSGEQFSLSQKTSSWDSQALLYNFVTTKDKTYQTYERAGRTVYLYGTDAATWVDNGVWYTIDGGGSLNKQELIDVATSI